LEQAGEQMRVIFGQEINIEEFFDMFPNVTELFAKLVIVKGSRKNREIIISLANFKNKNIKNKLESLGVLKDGILLKGFRVILVNDTNDTYYSNIRYLNNIKNQIIELNKHSKDVCVEWVLGTKGLKLAEEKTEQAKVIRELIDKGICKVCTELMDGTVMFSSGFAGEEVLDEIRKEKGELYGRSTADFLNEVLRLCGGERKAYKWMIYGEQIGVLGGKDEQAYNKVKEKFPQVKQAALNLGYGIKDNKIFVTSLGAKEVYVRERKGNGMILTLEYEKNYSSDKEPQEIHFCAPGVSNEIIKLFRVNSFWRTCIRLMGVIVRLTEVDEIFRLLDENKDFEAITGYKEFKSMASAV